MQERYKRVGSAYTWHVGRRALDRYIIERVHHNRWLLTLPGDINPIEQVYASLRDAKAAVRSHFWDVMWEQLSRAA